MKPGMYQHYSGKNYHVKGTARHSETREEMVIYQELYGDYELWVRPLKMFQESVLIEGKKQPRFTFIRELHIDVPPPDKRTI